MIYYINRDLLSVEEGVIAHGCNYFGAMGAGVAKQIRAKYPDVFVEYAKWLTQFKERKEALGLVKYVQVADKLWIANCITQGLAAYDGQLATPEAIGAALRDAFGQAAGSGLSLYMPQIGCGLGGLNWQADVEPIVKSLGDQFAQVNTYVCTWNG